MRGCIALALVLACVLGLVGCGQVQNKLDYNEVGSEDIEASLNDSRAAAADLGEFGMEYRTEAKTDPAYEQHKPVIVNDSPIVVQSDSTLSKPYENFLWAEKWSEHGWMSGDGMSVSHKFSDIDKEIPQITYGDDFEIYYKDGVELLSLSVYDGDFDRIHQNAKQEALSDLEEGAYYLVITVKEQGEYIETDEKYEYSGYECAYKIVIDNEASE